MDGPADRSPGLAPQETNPLETNMKALAGARRLAALSLVSILAQMTACDDSSRDTPDVRVARHCRTLEKELRSTLDLAEKMPPKAFLSLLMNKGHGTDTEQRMVSLCASNRSDWSRSKVSRVIEEYQSVSFERLHLLMAENQKDRGLAKLAGQWKTKLRRVLEIVEPLNRGL
jgi:hypothetical protein